MSSGPARHGRNEAQRTEKSPGPHCCGVPSKGVTSRNAAQPQPQDLLDLQHRDLAKRHPASRPWTGDIVAGWSRRWGRECFCKTLRAEGGILLQNSRGRGPYLLQTDKKRAVDHTGPPLGWVAEDVEVERDVGRSAHPQ